MALCAYVLAIRTMQSSGCVKYGPSEYLPCEFDVQSWFRALGPNRIQLVHEADITETAEDDREWQQRRMMQNVWSASR